MAPKYDNKVEMSMEQEGSYHSRQVEHIQPPSPAQTRTSYKTYEKNHSPSRALTRYDESHNKLARRSDDEDDDNYEEWTTTKRKVNHKVRQVETRVSRKLLVEDGRVIADSGPQVTTRIKEDNRVEESEKEKAPKNKGRFEALENAPECDSSSGRVLGEKKEIIRTTKETREENMQYHDEMYKELSGHDVHRKALANPHELVAISESRHSGPRGKMVHYSNKGKVYQDTDEILEVAKLDTKGRVTKERKHTRHHEEFSDTERPGDEDETERLRREPKVERSSRRHVDYVKRPDDFDTPHGSDSDGDDDEEARRKKSDLLKYNEQKHHQLGAGSSLLTPRSSSRFHHQEVARRDSSPDSGSERQSRRGRQHHRHHHELSSHNRNRSSSPQEVVEVPEIYRRNKEQMLNRKGLSSPSRSSSHLSTGHRSPNRARQHHQHHREDASVQARLTDEEIERRSMSSENSHRNKTRGLHGNSNSNSTSRNYYFGQSAQSRAKTPTKTTTSGANYNTEHKRSKSPATTSSASSSDFDPKIRRDGARSRDSGFRSPNQDNGTKDIYSVSSKKHPSREGAISPGSVRSVKTTTTTLVGGLEADRKRRSNSTREPPARSGSHRKSSNDHQRDKVSRKNKHSHVSTKTGSQPSRKTPNDGLFDDSASLSSFGPHSTTIRVPYRSKLDTNQYDRGTPAELSDCESVTTIMHQTGTRRGPSSSVNKAPQARYDYRTIIANVMPTITRRESLPSSPTKMQNYHNNGEVDRNNAQIYHVRVVDHNSPFKTDSKKPAKTVSELSESIAKLLSQVSNQNMSVKSKKKEAGPTGSDLDNNNQEADLNLNVGDYEKYKAMPARTRDVEEEEDDSFSVISIGSSMRSHKTYHVRSAIAKSEQRLDDLDLNHENDFPVEIVNLSTEQTGADETNKRSGSAWIFDPTDNSTKTIESPPKPHDTVPQVEQITENLGETNGGRSYYLELVDKPALESKINQPKEDCRLSSCSPVKQIEASLETSLLKTKLASKIALGNGPRTPMTKDKHTKSNNLLPEPAVDKLAANKKKNDTKLVSMINRRDRPIAGSTMNVSSGSSSSEAMSGPANNSSLGGRSKSSSCLAVNSTKTKYSIYGGLKGADRANKPVPRLSYSRAIGPKSHVQTKTAQIKTAPSRYLKIK